MDGCKGDERVGMGARVLRGLGWVQSAEIQLRGLDKALKSMEASTVIATPDHHQMRPNATKCTVADHLI